MPYDSDIIVIGCGNILFKDDEYVLMATKNGLVKKSPLPLPIILDGKDAWCRYNARILEISESINIVEQACKKIKNAGPAEQTLINPLNLKLPEGEYYSEIEAPRGISSIYIKSQEEKFPYRLKWRTASYYSVNLLRKLLVGTYLNDAIAIAGSLDIILPEVDK